MLPLPYAERPDRVASLVRRDERKVAMTAKQYGTIGLIGIGWFVVAVLILHIVESEYSPVNDFMSDYANGDYGWLMQSAFFGAGVGTTGIALGLRKTLSPGKRVTASFVLMLLAALGFFVAIAKTDPSGADVEVTTAGVLHVLGSLLLFVALLIAAWFLRGVFSRDPAWARLTKVQLWFAIAYTVTMVIAFATPENGPVGLTQRVFVPVMLAWLLTLAWNVRRRPAS